MSWRIHGYRITCRRSRLHLRGTLLSEWHATPASAADALQVHRRNHPHWHSVSLTPVLVWYEEGPIAHPTPHVQRQLSLFGGS